MSPRILIFIAADLVLSACVVYFALRRRVPAPGAVAAAMPGVVNIESVRALAAFAKGQHDRIGVYMRMNWSGMADQLPGVLAPLLDQLESEAVAQGLPADRNAMKALLATSLRSHGIGTGNAVRDALEKVA
jgi:hypothetical protein